MLGLRLDNTFLDMFPDVSINITMNNPLFDSNAIARTFSFPFSLPITPTNTEKLNQAHRVDSTTPIELENVTLFIDGVPVETGILQLNAATEKKIQVTFKNKSRNIIEKLSNTKIQNILGSEVIEATISNTSVFNVIPNFSTYMIVVEGIQFQYVSTQGDSVEHIVEQLSTAINAQLPNHAIWTVGQTQLIFDNNELPQFHIFLIYTGLTIAENVTSGQQHSVETDNYVKRIIENPVKTHTFPMIAWRNYYDGKNPLFGEWGWANYYQEGYVVPNTLQTEKQWQATYIPHIFLQYVIEQICSELDIHLDTTTFWDDEEIQQLLLFNNVSIDHPIQEITAQNQWINAYQYLIHFGDHVPKMTAQELLDAVADLFGLYLIIRDGSLKFLFKKDQVVAPPIDWTAKATPPYRISYIEKKSGVKFQQESEHDDYAVDEQLTPYVEGEMEQEVTTKFGTPYMATRSIFRTPHIDQVGTNPLTGKQDYDLRLLIYRGLQPASNGDQYPLATHENTNIENEKIGDLTLSPQYLYKTYHEAYIKLLRNKTITKKINLSINDILSIKDFENPRRVIHQTEGSIHGIIKSIQFKVGPDGISTSKVEFVSEL